MLSYGQLFILGIIVQAIITVLMFALTKVLKESNPYYQLVKALSIILLVSLVALIVSYIAQATFMGWI